MVVMELFSRTEWEVKAKESCASKRVRKRGKGGYLSPISGRNIKNGPRKVGTPWQTYKNNFICSRCKGKCTPFPLPCLPPWTQDIFCTSLTKHFVSPRNPPPNKYSISGYTTSIYRAIHLSGMRNLWRNFRTSKALKACVVILQEWRECFYFNGCNKSIYK